MKASFIIVIIGVLGLSEARPGLFYIPQGASQTTVLRDALGNQATSYAYHDGHSSSVAVSRNDVSKHLTYVPVPLAAPVAHHAPVIYQEPYIASPYAASPYQAYHSPAAYYGSYYL